MNNKVLFVFICILIRTYSTGNIDKKDLVVIPSETTEANLDDETISETSFKDESDFEVFQATSEWQTVKEGQAIPQGLHVQMNLQTGEKKAKLLDENENKRTPKETIKPSSKQEYVKIDQNIISKQRLKEALKDFKDKFKNEDLDDETISEHEKNKYRSIEDIKKELDGADIWVKKDIEIIQELVKKLNASESTKTEIISTMEELEYHVHQIDNAQDLGTLGGLTLLTNFLNKSDDEEVKNRAAFVIAAAAQSNVPVQRSLLDSGILPLLMRLVANKQSFLSTRKSAMYALSSVLRLYPKGTQSFLKIGGLSVLATLFQESGNDPLRIKSLTLLVDLLTEQMDSIRNKAKEMGIQDYEKATLKAPLFKAMYQGGWCELAVSLMTSTENDTREKILQALYVLWPACRTSFKNNKLSENLGKWRQQWQDEIKVDNEDDTGYLESLVKLVDKLVGRL